MEKKFFGYKAVLGAFLIMFISLGTATTLGVFLASLSADSGFPVTTVAYIGTSCTISCVIFSMVASKLMAKGTSLRVMVLIGLVANAVGMLCYTFAIPNNVISLVFFYLGGFLIGIALTFSAHAVCGAIIASWFIEDREKLMGMVFSGAGFGAAIVVFIAGQMFKVFTWRQCYYILAAFTIIVGFLVVFTLIRDPAKMGQKPKGWDTVKADAGDGAELPGMSLTEARKSKSYWMFAIMLIFVCCAGSGFTSYAPAWWQTVGGMSSTSAASYQSIYLIVSGLILLVVGAVFKKIGPVMFAIIVFGGYALCNFFTSAYTGQNSLLILTLVLGAIGYPLQASIPSLCGQSIFGPREFGAISASLMTFNYLGQFLYAPVMSVCGMKLGWIVYGVFTLIGLVILIAAIGASPYRKSLKN